MKKIFASLVALSLFACTNDDNSIVPDNRAPAGAIAVDMGFPSGTKWANMNLGAETPEGEGCYYVWGETTAFTDADLEWRVFNFTTYKWANGDPYGLTKYCYEEEFGIVDDKWELDLEDDAAHVNWGGEWVMPSQEEAYELFENCDFVWTEQNGVEGGLFTSKINGNKIFIPGRGYLKDSNHMSDGILGHYWCNNLYRKQPGEEMLEIHPPFAGSYLYFFKVTDRKNTGVGKAGRNGAFPVRPVIRKK